MANSATAGPTSSSSGKAKTSTRRGRTGSVAARVALVCLAVLLTAPSLARADVLLDGSLGPRVPITNQPPSGADTSCTWCILPSHGQTSSNGRNLFHSFSEFDVAPQESAVFFGGPQLSHIIGRITAGTRSKIEGRVGTSGTRASLYLLNPAGFLFGEGAAIDLPAAFYVSSANTLLFDDGLRFGTGTPASELSGGDPTAFEFTGETRGAIDFEGGRIIRTEEDQSLNAVASDVSVSGGTTLFSPGGTIRLAAVGGWAGAVATDIESFKPQDANSDLGMIRVEGTSILNVTPGSRGRPSSGRIVLRGGELVMDGGALKAGGDGVASAIDGELRQRIELRRSFVNAEGREWDGESSGVDGEDPMGVHLRAPDISIGDFSAVASYSESDIGGDIELISDRVEVRNGALILTDTTGAAPGGGIRIEPISRADVVVRDGGAIKTTTGGALAQRASGDGGSISIVADSLTLDRSSADFSSGAVLTEATEYSDGRAGAVDIRGGSASLLDGGQIESLSESGRPPGEIHIVLDGTLRLSGVEERGPALGPAPSAIGSQVPRDARPHNEPPGNIAIEAERVSLSDGALISARSFGASPAGDVTLVVREELVLRGGPSGTALVSSLGDDGDGGDVVVSAARVELIDGGALTASTTGRGRGGMVRVDTRGDLVVTGSLPTGGAISPSAIFAETLSGQADAGDSGGIALSAAGSVIVRDGGTLSIRTTGPGSGQMLRVDADRDIRLSGGALVRSTAQGSGDAGSIALKAGRHLTLSEGARIEAIAKSAGDAGDIRVEAKRQLTVLDSGVRAQSDVSLGGNISLIADGKVSLIGSQIATDVASGAGEGGNILIDPDAVVVNSSRITAKADAGHGGNILIVAGNYYQSADSVLDASSNTGIDGTIVIRGPASAIAGELAPLPGQFVDTSELLSAPCAARQSADRSTFRVQEREGLPVGPDGYLPLSVPSEPSAPAGEEGADADGSSLEQPARLETTQTPDCLPQRRDARVSED